ncbi:MAG: hypothetical protein GWO20_09000, partial [Candidatus Korarchaeota archaeon]|nr:hypothetical protein [Candidatus Korarchaeota archaeon]NIU82763.1 hypothetical protein [Candidatus Thorarchaeota archaeon]NIW13257.1 hypothetical protein [Candidatus Thorarchaeota archaeon]NIW51384.1 hypothetical protein [Candidatus Korarchaeota archaeon]
RNREVLPSIRGTVPDLINPPSGCRFHPRCDQAMEICSEKEPNTVEIGKNHLVKCHLNSSKSEEDA